MNILMLHPHDLYSSQEPWTIRIKKLARELKNKGHLVRLIYFPLDKKDARTKHLDDGIEVIALDRRTGLFILLRNIVDVVKLAKWADVIHFQKCYYYVVLPVLIAGWLHSKPTHYDWDDWETKIFYYSNPKNKPVGEFINLFEKLIPRAVDTVSISSRHLRSLCLQRGVVEDCIFPAPVGADLEQFIPNRNPPLHIKTKYNIPHYLVLYIGQLHGGQYTELFIKAAGVVLRHRRDVSFMIVGDGYRAQELKELAKREQLDGHVIFTGFVTHDEIPYYIADAEVCVACFEDNDITRCKSPLKIAEYLASGKAIVASNVGEVRNMVGSAGILVNPGDSNALAEGILRLMANNTLRENLGKFARQKAEKRYNWSTTATSLILAYNKSLTQQNKRNG